MEKEKICSNGTNPPIAQNTNTTSSQPSVVQKSQPNGDGRCSSATVLNNSASARTNCDNLAIRRTSNATNSSRKQQQHMPPPSAPVRRRLMDSRVSITSHSDMSFVNKGTDENFNMEDTCVDRNVVI